jgi:hypothetical protein
VHPTMISKHMVCSTQTMHLSCVKLDYLQMDRNDHPLEPSHLVVPSGASKTISEPMVRLVQTMQLSCVKISTICKQTKMSIHLSLVTLEYHRVRPKQFLSLWYVWRKSCTDTNTISKRMEMRFHMTHVTKVFYRVFPK